MLLATCSRRFGSLWKMGTPRLSSWAIWRAVFPLCQTTSRSGLSASTRSMSIWLLLPMSGKLRAACG